MPLTLNIPAIEEDAILLAETRPAKIAVSLTEWQNKNPEDFASDLHDELYLLNRQNVSPANRLQALEVYLPYVKDCASSLAQTYCNSLLPLSEHAKADANKAEALWLELGYGYKLVLTDFKKQLIKFGAEKTSALSIYRAIEAISHYKSVHHQTYVNPPSHVWSDLHHLYFYAVKLGYHKVEIETQARHADALLLPTIEDIYKHSLLFTLAQPDQLTQHEMLLIENYLTHHIRRTSITAANSQQSAPGMFIIQLDSDKAPAIYSKQKEAADPLSDVMLQTLDMVVAMHEDLKTLQNHQMPKSGSIPTNSQSREYIDLLTHLIKNWGVNPKRLFKRTQKKGHVELYTGLQSLHSLLSGDKSLPTRWDILNISPTGMALRHLHSPQRNISVGTLVGIKSQSDEHITIGMIRRINCANREQLDIGIQLIAPQAASGLALIDAHSIDEPLLLLPQISAVNQAATIIAPRGTYSPARVLGVKTQNIVKNIMLTKLIECTHLIERIQYSDIS